MRGKKGAVPKKIENMAHLYSNNLYWRARLECSAVQYSRAAISRDHETSVLELDQHQRLRLYTTTMGWFWGSSDDKNGSEAQDPLRGLDPSLREFLAKESPVKYSSSNPSSIPPAQPNPQTPQSARSPEARTSSPAPSSEKSREEKIPAASLYQDGRYADLWRSYQSQSETEAAGKSDQEKINDILEGYKYRKAEIGRAALENCALEQWDVNECFRTVSWSRTLNLCRAENKKFERCYLMQSVSFRITLFGLLPCVICPNSPGDRNSSKL